MAAMSLPDGELMELHSVPASHIDRAWKEGASDLAKACETSGGEITGDQLKMILARGERILLRGSVGGEVVGWVVVRFDQLPNVRVMHICELYSPNNMHAEFFRQLKELASLSGCSEVRCSASPSHARLYRSKFGFEPVYETLRVVL